MRVKKFNVYIIVKTGLHIGAGNENIGIGEMDNAIIKDRNGMPYIPASSLKGKLRSLYELKTNKIGPKGGPYEFNQDAKKDKNGKVIEPIYDEISMFFGKSGNNTDGVENLGPTRFIFRDLKLAKKEDIEKLNLKSFDRENLYTLENYEVWQQEGQPLTEEKTEVAINRKTGTAGGLQFSPRPVERVFAGTVFKGELVVRFFEKKSILDQWTKKFENNNLDNNIVKNILGDKFNKFSSEEEIMKYCFWIKENDLIEFGFLKKLLEDDYLGGMGTRGSGQVEIIFEEIEKNE